MDNKGLIIVYTGNGKGKTTAALGLAIRSAGWENKVAIIQFIKGYKKTGEWKLIERLPEIDIYQTLDDQSRHIGKPEDKHLEAVKSAMKLARVIIKKNNHKVVILDEINNAIEHGLVEEGEIMKLIKERPVEVSLVFTGRGAPEYLIDQADLVTEMREIKHPFTKKIGAKKGIDY
ncbi:MAG: cob(I)yrinic acid a,c-diamide adenosyltransferase [Patescibacteria group bacterium]